MGQERLWGPGNKGMERRGESGEMSEAGDGQSGGHGELGVFVNSESWNTTSNTNDTTQ